MPLLVAVCVIRIDDMALPQAAHWSQDSGCCQEVALLQLSCVHGSPHDALALHHTVVTCAVQVLMARGTANGWVQWGDRRYELKGAPAYSEKNWGAGFPKKWWWVQAEEFQGRPDVALTAVGGSHA